MVEYHKYYNNGSQVNSRGKAGGGGRSGSRLWMGCCGGCAGIVVAMIIIIAVSAYLMFRAQPVMPPEAFFLSDADGFAVLQLNPEDEGLIALARSMAEDPPDIMELSEDEKQALQDRAGEIRGQMEKWLPLNLVALLYHMDTPENVIPMDLDLGEVDGEVPESVVKWLETRSDMKRFNKGLAVSIRRGGLLMRMLVRIIISGVKEQGGVAERYRNARTGITPAGIALAAYKNNFMLSDRERMIHDWIDALKDRIALGETGYNGPPQLESMYDRLTRPAFFFFALSNREGEAQSFLSSFREIYENSGKNRSEIYQVIDGLEVVTANMDAIGGDFRLLGPDSAQLDIYAECVDERSAREVGEELVKILQHMAKDDVTVEGDVEGRVAHVRFTHHDFEAFLRTYID